MTITVLLPAYNAAPYIQQALRCLQSQTFKEFSVLVLDDGSTDATPELVTNTKDSRIHLSRQEQNRGLIATLNRGLAEAHGAEWLVRMDADDVCTSDRMAKQLAFASRNPDCSVFSCQSWLFGDMTGPQRWPLGAAAISARLPFDTPILHAAAWFNGKFFRDHKIRYRADALHAEDYDLWAQVHDAGGTLDSMPDRLYGYRIHGKSVTQSARSAQEKTACEIRYRLLARAGISFTEQEKNLLESAQFAENWALAPSVPSTLHSILTKIRMVPLPGLTRVERNYEFGRFLVSALPRPRQFTDKIRLAKHLYQVSPEVCTDFLYCFLRGRA